MSRRPRPWLACALWRGRRAGRDVVLRRGASDPKTLREDVALQFLRGDGIEIGALDFPLRLPRGARVRYVDHLDGPGLRETHGNTLREGRPLVVPDVVDDGARLAIPTSAFRTSSSPRLQSHHFANHRFANMRIRN
jgi:hypothetical protein